MAIKIEVHVIIGTVVYTSEIKLPEDKLSRIPVPLPDCKYWSKEGTHTIPVINRTMSVETPNKQMTFFSSFFFYTKPCIQNQLLKLKR